MNALKQKISIISSSIGKKEGGAWKQIECFHNEPKDNLSSSGGHGQPHSFLKVELKFPYK
jgi:hypothetical protein